MIEQVRFMGATVKGFSAVAGWQEQPSQVRIELVEDIGDSFQEEDIGTPKHFEFNGFVFDGLIKDIEYSDDLSGKIHSVLMTTPTELLDGTQVIVGSYNGIIPSSVKNVFNVFGYWENQLGFGGASVNDLGMIWESTDVQISGNTLDQNIILVSGDKYGIKPALEAMQGSIYNGNYGRGIEYNDHIYKANLDNLPESPQDYRIGNGTSMSLRELIDTVCHDGGFDYMVKMAVNSGSNEHDIYIRTVDRAIEPNPNKIQEFIQSKSGLVHSWSNGKEMRFDETNLFLVGGDVNMLMLQENQSSILPFWGYDVNNNIILGGGDGNAYNVNINTYPLLDIIGTASYNIDQIEMRLALHSYDMWAGYVQMTKPEIATLIGLSSAFSLVDGLFDRRFQHDYIQQNLLAANMFGSRNSDGEFVNKSQVLYNYIRNYIQFNYGRRFLVATPLLVNFKLEHGTNRIIYSWEPTDGGYTNEGSAPLGVNIFNEDYIKMDDGRFPAFVKYENANLIDPSSLMNANFLIQDNNVYVPCRVLQEFGVVYVNGQSCVVISVDTPLFYKTDDSLGGVEQINAAFGINMEYAANIRAGYLPGRLNPQTAVPVGVAIPMKSNEYTYGPWTTASGLDGRVEFRKEDGLVPWQYGGYELLNQAAQAYIDNFVTQTKTVENGSVTVVGMPEFSLGDVLVSGGPIITSINCSFSTDRIVTNYELRTYTPLKGQFSRDNAERIRRFGLTMQGMRKTLRQYTRNHMMNSRRSVIDNINPYAFMGNTSKALDYGLPHGATVGHLIPDPNNPSNYIPLVSLQTYEETVGNIRTDNFDIYNQTACVGLEGLFRSVLAGSGQTTYNTGLPYIEAPRNGLKNNIPNSINMNPFQPGNDMEWVLNGINTYSGLHNRKLDNALQYEQKPLAMRGPILMNAWGWDLAGNPVPNASESNDTAYNKLSRNEFSDNYLKQSNKWKTGPLDHRWDEIRKVWCAPYSIWGSLTGNTLPRSSGTLRISIDDEPSDYFMPVWNPWSSTIGSGILLKVDPDMLNNRMSIGAVDCDG